MDVAAIAADLAAARSSLEALSATLGIAKDSQELPSGGERESQVGEAPAAATRKRADAPAYPAFAPGRTADALLPLLTAPPVQSRQPAPSGSEGWGW